MISSGQLNKHSIICDTFGPHKVDTITRQLRELGLYPSYRELSIQDTALLLYCLAATPNYSIREHCIRAADELEHLETSNGQRFFDVLCDMLEKDAFHALKSLFVSQLGGLAYLECDSINMVYLDTRRPGAGLDQVSFFTKLPANYMAAYAAIIKERNMTFNMIN